MRWLMVAALLAVASPANAETFHTTFCAKVADVARVIMEARQNGMPMEKAIEAAEQGGDGRDLAIVMVEAAYDRPRWHSNSSQRREVEDFGEFFYKVCYNSGR
jgi:hypothetical protein